MKLELGERFANCLPHEAFAGQRAVVNERSGSHGGADCRAEEGDFAPVPFEGAFGSWRFEKSIPRLVPASVSGRLGEQAIEFATRGDLGQVTTAMLRRCFGYGLTSGGVFGCWDGTFDRVMG